jgi:hypothetical protein
VRWLAGLVGVVVAALPLAARADHADGLYGRFDGDLTLSATAGGGVVLGSDDKAAALGELRLRYLETAGLVVGVEWRPEGGERLIAGMDLRPVFLWHFLTGQ